jgi:hypothetical protein
VASGNPIINGPVPNLPPQSSPVLQGQLPSPADGAQMTLPFTSAWYTLWRALVQRAGAPIFANESDSAIAGVTPVQLQSILNFVTSGSPAGTCVLPMFQPGQFAVVVNTTPGTELDIQAPNGMNIDGSPQYRLNPGGGINKPTTQIFWFANSTDIYSTQLA